MPLPGADLSRVEDAQDNIIQSRSLTSGGTKYQFASNPSSFSDVRVGDTSAVIDPNKLALLFPTIPDTVPNVARAGALPTHRNPYANRPVIEVYRKDGVSGQPMLVGKYDDWICGNVVESDAEKFDITETFGTPHFFTSGRFVRKYQFSGMLRAAPVNYQAVQSPILRTPQSVLFRVFYEYYLRSTKQAELGYYTRIVVDSEAYEGYVTTYNVQRSADSEAIVPFVFTFIGTKRYNTQTENDARSLLKRFESKEKVKNPIVTQLAQAELADAHGKLDLTALVDRIEIGTISVAEQQPKNGAVQTLMLKAEGVPQVLLVKPDAPGIDLVYDGVTSSDHSSDDASVNGNPVRISSAGVPITYKITNFAQLRQEFERRKSDAAPGSDIAGVAGFHIVAENGANVDVFISMTLSGVAGMKVTSLVISAGSPAGVQSDTPTKSSTPRPDVVMAPIDRTALQAGNVLPVRLLFTLKQDDDSSLLAAAFANPQIEVVDVSAEPKFGPSHTSIDADKGQVQATNVDLTHSITPNAGAGTVQSDGSLVLQSPVDLRTVNPFKVCDSILVRFRPKVTVASYATFDSFPFYIIEINLGKSNANDILARVGFIRFTGNSDASSSLILGTALFAIYNKNNQAPDDATISALVKGTLGFQFGDTVVSVPLGGATGPNATYTKTKQGLSYNYGVYASGARVTWNGQFIAVTVPLNARILNASAPRPPVSDMITALTNDLKTANVNCQGFIEPTPYAKP